MPQIRIANFDGRSRTFPFVVRDPRERAYKSGAVYFKALRSLNIFPTASRTANLLSKLGFNGEDFGFDASEAVIARA
jgi:hypothetical protein